MVSSWILLSFSIAYSCLLFGVAWLGDRRVLYAQRTWLRPVICSLALAVYYASWTFYGAIGSAMHHGIGYLPIYLGPLLFVLFGWRILERLALIARAQNTFSIAGFIASRYGHSRRLAALVAMVTVIGIVPYLALQYKTVAMSLTVLSGYDNANGGLFHDPTFYVALLLALFAILFGTSQADATGHHHGMMLAIALESVIKLAAIVAAGIFAWLWLNHDHGHVPITHSARTLLQYTPSIDITSQTLLSFLAMVCLPYQFHVAVVECNDVADIRRARWLFGIYLALISAMVIPIAAAGLALFGRDGAATNDAMVLALPLSQDNTALALIVYIGGLSAATGMVIVSSIALATMVSHDLVMPVLLRRRPSADASAVATSRMLWIRRAVIVLLAIAAYGYQRGSGNDTTLTAYSLIALAAVAQFAPGIIGGLYGHGTSGKGVETGLLLGFAAWLYTLLLPALTHAGWLAPGWLVHGPLGIAWLRPQQLFGMHGWDPLAHGTFWSLLANTGAMLIVSVRRCLGVNERLRAIPFLEPYAPRPAMAEEWLGHVHVGDLLALVERVVGERHGRRAFREQAQLLARELQPDMLADRTWVQFTERLLAAAIGASSARLVLTSLLRGSGMELDEVVAVLDEAGQELRFNRQILSTTLENISAAVSVVDPRMRLTAWNQRYQQLFGYPNGMLYVGRPVADLIRYNAERGELGEGEVEDQIERRIRHMRAGSPHVFERTRSDGKVIEMRGQALPGGGYVTSYNDITDYKRAEKALLEANETLEQRVAERSRAAELAQQSKTRFLAAISHDVLQPLNAARLFASALRDSHQSNEEQHHLAERVDASLRAAEELLDGLLDVSRLDTGGMCPTLEDFDVSMLLRELAAQYAPVAASRGLRLQVHTRLWWVRSDRRLLRRVMQNFLANALRYTRQGRIVLGMRGRGATVELQVWDTGPGIPEHHMRQIFEEFRRYQQPFDWGEQGLGLGLSICQRISRLLEHDMSVRSQVGRGSMFSILLPRVDTPTVSASIAPGPANTSDAPAGLRVLCVDNDHEILDGMRALLGRWQVEVMTASTIDEALLCVHEQPHLMLVDYHLHDRLDGLATLDALRAAAPAPLQGALLSADGRDELKQLARDRGYRLLTKPIKPASLRAFLTAFHDPLRTARP